MLCRWHIASKTLKLTKTQYSCFILAYFFIYYHQTFIKERTWTHFHQFDWKNVALFLKEKNTFMIQYMLLNWKYYLSKTMYRQWEVKTKTMYTYKWAKLSVSVCTNSNPWVVRLMLWYNDRVSMVLWFCLLALIKLAILFEQYYLYSVLSIQLIIR